MFWVLLSVLAFSFLVTPLLAPKPKGAQKNLDEVRPPTASRGNPVPVVFGTQKIAPNVVWYGNIRAQDIRTVTGNRSLLNPFAVNHSTVTGHRYGADISGVLCHGPIDELVDVYFGDVSMRKTNSSINAFNPTFAQLLPAGNGPVTYTITAPEIFGGEDGDGGVNGKMEFYFGKLTQTASAKLATLVSEAVSQYKGIVHFTMYDALFGTSPFLQPMFAVVRRCPQLVSPDAATANINGSANAADVIFEIMTNTRWGIGKSPAVFDMDSFTAAAITLKAEGMGVDALLDSQDSAEAAIGEFLRHVDGVLFSHPLTGKITLKLARADYDIEDLLHVTKSNALNFSSFKRSSWPETINEVKVNYVLRGVVPDLVFKQDTQQAQNLASMQAMGDVITTTVDFPFFSTSVLALKAGFRMLRTVSVPLASGTLTVNRTMASLTIGAVFVLDWEPLGISNLVMRVVNMKLGPLDNNAIELSVVEDVFSTAPVVFVSPPSTSWTTPVTTPAAHLRAKAIPAMYFLVRGDKFIGLSMVVRGNGAATSWDGTYNDDPSVADTPVVGTQVTADSPFTPAGTTVAIYPYNTDYQDEVGFIVQDLASDLSRLVGTDADGLVRGDNLAWIDGPDGGEIIAWREVIPQATPGQYLILGVLRGQFDTVPLDHKIGDTVFFFAPDLYQPYYPGMVSIVDPPTATSMAVAGKGYKFWPALKGITGSQPVGPPAGKIQHPAVNTPAIEPHRAVLPLPVGDTRLNAVKNNAINPATPIPDSNALSWVHRNRLLQVSTLPHDYGDVSIEATETYEVEIRHVSRTTGADVFGVLRTAVGQVTPFVYTNFMFEGDLTTANGGTPVSDVDARRTGGGIRFLIRSVRGAYKSYDIAVPGFIRKQVSGYPLIPSFQFLNIYVPPVFFGEAIDTLYLQAWYIADGAGNVYTGSRLDTWADQSGNARHITRTAGTPAQTATNVAINNKPSIDFPATTYFSDLTIPLEGSMSFFAVIRYDALGAYHNFFDTLASMGGAPPLILWFTDTNKIEPDAETNAANKPDRSATWGILVVHNNQVSSKLGFKTRWNSTLNSVAALQIAADNGVDTAVGTIPGSIGSPANLVANMFNRSAGSTFQGKIAEFGFYGRNKDGDELQLEAYLFDKYGFVALTDTVGLAAWYCAAAGPNTIVGGAITVFSDLSSNGHDLTTQAGNILPVAKGLNGRTIGNFQAAGAYLSDLTLPLEGALTYFAVFKITTSGTYQNLFEYAAENLWLFWDQPSDKWQLDGRLEGAAVAGSYVTMVLHVYNVVGATTYKLRINGAQIGTNTFTPASNVPGSPGSPAATTFTMFHRATGSFKFTSQIAEWGFFTTNKDGAEAALESYLRAKYKTW